jgi:hypothetical protein
MVTQPQSAPATVEELQQRLKHITELKKAGLYKPNLSPDIKPDNRSEFLNGQELVLKEGLIWLHQVGQALIVAGIAYDSRADCHDTTGQPELWLQRVVRGPAPRRVRRHGRAVTQGGLWEKFDIPVGCVNGKDLDWLVKTLLTPKEADLALALIR